MKKKIEDMGNGWTKVHNACCVELCTKQLGPVCLQVWKGINGTSCKMEIFGNPYFKSPNVYFLNEREFEKAIHEADETYRRMISEGISLLLNQIFLLN